MGWRHLQRPAQLLRGEPMTLVEEPTTSMKEPATLVEVLLRYAIERPDATAYVFLRDDGKEETLTFGQLARRAQAIAAQLQGLTCVGDRAILLYQPGLNFIEAILACFFARLVAVPVSP